MKRATIFGLVGTMAMAVGLIVPIEADAVPAFARTYGHACSKCHTAWPALSAYGRDFKESGYMDDRGQPEEQVKMNDWLTLPKVFPLALVLKSRPFDQKKGGKVQLRALHELEIFFAGNAFKYGSFFVELELEDENNFEVETAVGVAGFHPHQLHRFVPQELVEGADGVAASAHAGHHVVWQAALRLQNLGPGLPPDDRLEVPHQHGVRVGASWGWCGRESQPKREKSSG